MKNRQFLCILVSEKNTPNPEKRPHFHESACEWFAEVTWALPQEVCSEEEGFCTVLLNLWSLLRSSRGLSPHAATATNCSKLLRSAGSHECQRAPQGAGQREMQFYLILAVCRSLKMSLLYLKLDLHPRVTSPKPSRKMWPQFSRQSPSALRKSPRPSGKQSL